MKALPGTSDCAGCSACFAACPCGAISMTPDEEGFLIPSVLKESCVDCGRCTSVCPVLRHGQVDDSPNCFAARSLDRDVLMRSTSGGVFQELARETIACGGIVYGCAYDRRMEACHIGVETEDGVKMLGGSKYVQSDMKDCFREISAALKSGRKVLFSGTPCQVAGLRSFLGGGKGLLLTVEVICHGVPSPMLFNQLKDGLEALHGKLIGLTFRDKAKGWTNRSVTGLYGQGKIAEQGPISSYNQAFLKGLSIRKSCGHCEFTGGRSGADITLGDFWGIEHVSSEMNDGLGVSAVLIHTRAGQEAFDRLGVERLSVECEDVCKHNPSYQSMRSPNPKRDAYMRKAIALGFTSAIGFTHQGVMMRLASKVRNVVKKAFGGEL